MTAQASGRGNGEPECKAKASVKLRPLTIWLSLPLIQRVHSFLEPLILQLGSEAMQRCGLQLSRCLFLLYHPNHPCIQDGRAPI